MIRSEVEYRMAVGRLMAEERRMETQLQSLQSMNLSPEVIERVMASLHDNHRQLAEEIECYAQCKSCEKADIDGLSGLGRAVIGMRIAQGISQTELADRLGVTAKTISRSECNEYYGISLERAARLFDALGVEVRVTIERKPAAAAA